MSAVAVDSYTCACKACLQSKAAHSSRLAIIVCDSRYGPHLALPGTAEFINESSTHVIPQARAPTPRYWPLNTALFLL